MLKLGLIFPAVAFVAAALGFGKIAYAVAILAQFLLLMIIVLIMMTGQPHREARANGSRSTVNDRASRRDTGHGTTKSAA